MLSLLRQPDLARFIVVRMTMAAAGEMLAVAVGWHVYALTGAAWSLALAGLAPFLPSLGLVLVTGHVADSADRRKVISASAAALALAALALFVTTSLSRAVWPIYVALLVQGAAQAFASPALSSALPGLVSARDFPRAVPTVSSAFKIAMIAGPAMGGFIYAFIGVWLFAVATCFYAAAAVLTLGLPVCVAARLPTETDAPEDQSASAVLAKLLAGVRYVRSNRVLLGAISLDLFAVLFGGVTALLPIFASDILHATPVELGLLRAGPSAGSVLVGVALAMLPLRRRIGAKMFLAVAGYGVATLVFAVSTSLWLSLAAMVMLGACDMISVVIRQTLVQIATPDAMRGRVSAISWVFVGASNQLGEFESGAVAALIGAASSALLGGIATLAVVALWAVWFPELRDADRMEKPREPAPEGGCCV